MYIWIQVGSIAHIALHLDIFAWLNTTWDVLTFHIHCQFWFFFCLLLLLDLICIQFCSIEHIYFHFIFSLIVHTHGMYRYQNLWWNVSCMVALTCSTDACTLICSQMLTEFCLLNQLFLKQSALDQIYKQHFSVCHSNSSLNYIFRFWYTYTNLDIHVLLLVFYYYYHFLSA
jgi:hypothetical protein